MTSADRRARERANLHEKILDAARALFAKHGYEAVTLRKVAQAIDYTAAALYGHFRDKEHLIRTLCAADYAKLSGSLAQLASVADPLERIRLMGHGYVQFAREHPQHYRLMFMSPRCVEPDEEALKRKDDPHRDGYAFLRMSVQQAIDRRLLRPQYQDAELLTQTLWAGVHGVASLEITHSNDDWVAWRAIEQRTAAMIDGLLAGFAATEPPARARKAKP